MRSGRTRCSLRSFPAGRATERDVAWASSFTVAAPGASAIRLSSAIGTAWGPTAGPRDAVREKTIRAVSTAVRTALADRRGTARPGDVMFTAFEQRGDFTRRR